MLFFPEAQNEIGLLSTQLRNIERKMLRAVRERNTRSLAATGLPFLLESTYRAIFALLDDLAIARAVIDRHPVVWPVSLHRTANLLVRSHRDRS